jgi:DNA mismatch repair protein MutS
MRQYLDLKEQHPDALLFFRCGDFYEMFFEDAVTAARALDLVLTSRDKGKEDSVPMCGVPYHAARGYLARLTEMGHKVAVCEQMEDPKLAKGLVKREVVRVITPGVVLDDEVLDPKLPRYLAALVPTGKGRDTDAPTGLAYLDVTTGELYATELPHNTVLDELIRVAPREVLADGALLGKDTGPLSILKMRYRVPWNPAAIPSADEARAQLRALLAPSAEMAARDAAARDAAFAVFARDAGGRGMAGSGRGFVAAAAREAARDSATSSSVTIEASDLAAREEAARRATASLDERPLALRAAATVIAYAKATQPAGTLPITALVGYDPADAVVLDETAIANLELTETLIGRRTEGSLLHVIDETVTAPGARLLRRWLLYPLLDVAQIRRRQDAVAWLVERPALTEQIRRALSRVADLERLAGKATLGVATPRDLGRLRDALCQLPDLVALVRSGALGRTNDAQTSAPKKSKRPSAEDVLDPVPALLDLQRASEPALAELAARLVDALVDDPPYLLKDGSVIRAGYDKTVDECRRLADGGKDEILAIEAREQRDSGITSLKVRYNRVFGYYIEITKTHLAKVPSHYIRKQTIATGERYVTTELADLEKKVLTAEETLTAREAELFRAECTAVAAIAAKISAAGAALAVLDACASLADVAARRGYCRPIVDDGLALDLSDARHPVIESLLPPGSFVPNDCRLDPDAEQLVLITGPNMAGKSTYMRQVAQIVLLAQMGSFVPAKAATIGVCDRVFTRVGAADNLSRGDSTFMVEMRETAAILAKATRRSLVILDEVGRGTSTFDGVSIAWAVAEYLHDSIGARTLFATHYHELVALADSRPRVRNVSVAVREHNGEIIFLRRVVPGGANKSYGIDVARLAGLPRHVIGRSREIMSKLEGGAQLGGSTQLSLLPSAPPSPMLARIASADIDRMTPLEALQLLAELKSLA